MRGKDYCRPCRTCPHEREYLDFWDPGCAVCVRDLHTLLALDGPMIRDMAIYVVDALRRGVAFNTIRTWRFTEETALENWSGGKSEPFHLWVIDRPPHFDLPR